MIPGILKIVMLPGVVCLLMTTACKPPGANSTQPTTAPVAVKTVLPHRGEIARTVTLPTFRVLAYQEATLYAKVSGYLKTINVDKGDSVTNGQLLAEIEVPELQADEIQFKSETDIAQTNYERMAEARKKSPDLIVPQTVDDLRGQWEVAQAKLQRTHTLLKAAKLNFAALPASLLTDATAFIPPAVAARAARMTVELLGRTRPPLNLVISNVPGPRNPLFLAGAKLESLVPVSVVIDGVGLNMTVMSYRDRMDFGIVSDRDQIDDVWPLLHGAAAALEEFEHAIGAGKSRPRPKRGVRSPA